MDRPDMSANADMRDSRNQYSISSLRLDLDSARAGKTWLLLPLGFRDQDSGGTYPLPGRFADIQKLAGISAPPSKNDSGCVYLNRCMKKFRMMQARRSSALHDIGRRHAAVEDSHRHYTLDMKALKKEARDAVEEVRVTAAESIASLTDLFSMGRQGLKGQMQAHLDGEEWQGEKVNNRAFRECFRMVTQAVKGLGLPSNERKKAEKAVLDEVAAALDETRKTLALAPGSDPEETKH